MRLQPRGGSIGVVMPSMPRWMEAGGRRDVPVRARERAGRVQALDLGAAGFRIGVHALGGAQVGVAEGAIGLVEASTRGLRRGVAAWHRRAHEGLGRAVGRLSAHGGGAEDLAVGAAMRGDDVLHDLGVAGAERGGREVRQGRERREGERHVFGELGRWPRFRALRVASRGVERRIGRRHAHVAEQRGG